MAGDSGITGALPSYRMGQQGKVVIFKHSKFENKAACPQLQSSDKDLAEVFNFWKNQKVSSVKPFNDMTLSDMEKAIKDVSEDSSNADAGFLVLVFLTYGDTGLIYAKDRPVALQRLIAPLKSDRCLHLAGKPKLIILQTTLPLVQADAAPEKVTTISSEADFMYLWSRMPADRFMEDPRRSGSLFISKLISAMKEHTDLDLLKIMTRTLAAIEIHLKGTEEGRVWLDMNQTLPFAINQLRMKLYIKA